MSATATRPAAYALIAISLLAVFAMLHHPTLASPTLAQAVDELARERWLNGTVHGVMVMVLAVYYWAFSFLTSQLGSRRWAASLGQVALAFACALLAGAAMISGFVLPEFAAEARDHALGEAQLRAVFELLFATNQTLARAGTTALGGALCCWGTALLVGPPSRAVRLLAGLGLSGGGAIVFGQLTGAWALDVAGMTAVTVVLAAWACGSAWWLLSSEPAD